MDVRTLFKTMLGQDTETDQPLETKYSRFEPKPNAKRGERLTSGDALTRMKVKQNTRLAQRLIRENPELAPQTGSYITSPEQLSNDGSDQIPLSVLLKALPGKVKVVKPSAAPQLSLS